MQRPLLHSRHSALCFLHTIRAWQIRGVVLHSVQRPGRCTAKLPANNLLGSGADPRALISLRVFFANPLQAEFAQLVELALSVLFFWQTKNFLPDKNRWRAPRLGAALERMWHQAHLSLRWISGCLPGQPGSCFVKSQPRYSSFCTKCCQHHVPVCCKVCSTRVHRVCLINYSHHRGLTGDDGIWTLETDREVKKQKLDRRGRDGWWGNKSKRQQIARSRRPGICNVSIKPADEG